MLVVMKQSAKSFVPLLDFTTSKGRTRAVINSQAGFDIAGQVSDLGWYLQVTDPLTTTVRTERDMSFKVVILGVLAVFVLMTGLYFYFTQMIGGAILAAMAWLTHMSIAFSLLGLLPWVAWHFWRGWLTEVW